mmetsp:Transcript_14166/g.34091  ORF Transcript_14166/g.34091 Transcript_14166/m.34091 type:complete len:601 (-) Transcript_14166:185-1987(-)
MRCPALVRALCADCRVLLRRARTHCAERPGTAAGGSSARSCPARESTPRRTGQARMVRAGKDMKGAAKKAPLTEEERLVQAEMEALKAEEDRRKKEEGARAMLKQRQLNEMRYAYINSIKIHNQWRKIMRLAKVEDLRKEIEILSQNHEREVDRKDAIIQMLDRDLEDAEEQHQMALRSHLSIVDSLIALQYTRVRALEDEFQRHLRALEEEFDTERQEIVSAHFRQKRDMQDLMEAMEEEFERAKAEAQQEFESQREEIKNRNSEEYNVLKISLESTIEDLEKHFEDAHRAYLQSTDARTQSFKQLTKQDGISARTIEKRMRKQIRLQDSLVHWRTKIATNSREWEERNRALRNEKEIMSRHYQELKGGMNGFRNKEGEKLKALILNSGAAAKDLDDKLLKAEKLLKLSELNRKMETEHEKVAPFYASVAADGASEEEKALAAAFAEVEAAEGKAQLAAGAKAAGVKSGAGGGNKSVEGTHDHGPGSLSSWGSGDDTKPVEEYEYLNRFFQRYNKVFMDQTAIDRERKRLDQENEDLRTILKQYLDGISINEDVINNPANPLIVVNNKLMLAQAARAQQAHQAAHHREAPPQLQYVNAN